MSCLAIAIMALVCDTLLGFAVSNALWMGHR